MCGKLIRHSVNAALSSNISAQRIMRTLALLRATYHANGISA